MIASQVDISKALLVDGWMSEKELTWLAHTASECLTIVEFGSFMGRSTRALADNSPDDCKIYAVDPWTGFYNNVIPPISTFVMPQFIDNLRDHIESGKVIIRRMYSDSFSLDIKVDMVFIDGDHSYEGVVHDINKARSILKPGGMLCGHDYDVINWPGTVKAVNELLGLVSVEDTIWHTRKF